MAADVKDEESDGPIPKWDDVQPITRKLIARPITPGELRTGNVDAADVIGKMLAIEERMVLYKKMLTF